MKLQDLQGKYKDVMAFIVGAGPSLHFQDTTPLKDYVTFAINSGILKQPEPDYFVADDWHVKVWSYFQRDLAQSKCIKLFYEKKLKGYTNHIQKDQIIWFDHKTWFDGQRFHKDGLVMTRKASKPIIGARTSSGSAIHLAHIMGCSPIVLLGSDCCYHGKKRYFWEFDGERRPEVLERVGEFNPIIRKDTKRDKYVDKHTVQFEAYWKQLAAQAKKQGITIINASGGILDAFPRMGLGEVLKKYGKRKKFNDTENT